VPSYCCFFSPATLTTVDRRRLPDLRQAVRLSAVQRSQESDLPYLRGAEPGILRATYVAERRSV